MPRNAYILILAMMGIGLAAGFGAYVTLGWGILLGLTILLVLPPGFAALLFLLVRRHPWISTGTVVLLVMTALGSTAGLVHVLCGGPHSWVVLVIAAAWAMATASMRIDYVRYRRWSRIRQVLCECCGYDLRASEERCPECGTPILEHYRWYRGTHMQNMLPKTGPAENPPEPPSSRD